jgi:hypothetical protein
MRIIGVIINGIRDNKVVPHTSIALIFDFDKIKPEIYIKEDMKNQFEMFSVKKTQYSESFAKVTLTSPLKWVPVMNASQVTISNPNNPMINDRKPAI